MDRLDKKVSILLQKLHMEYGDVVTYKVSADHGLASLDWWGHVGLQKAAGYSIVCVGHYRERGFDV